VALISIRVPAVIVGATGGVVEDDSVGGEGRMKECLVEGEELEVFFDVFFLCSQ
jgi:hypothetical protein